MQNILNQEYWNNTILDYLTTLGVLLVAIILLRLLRHVVLRRLKAIAERSVNKIDDFIVRSVERSLVPVLYIAAFYMSLQHLQLTARTWQIIGIGLSAAVTFFMLRLVTGLFNFLLQRYISRQEHAREKSKQVKGIMIIVTAFVWIIGLLFLLDNWGVNVTTFIAGLGIGGVAIALAGQTILADLFSYFVIFFDRPFEIDDFIIVEDKMGTVEYIGIKTTRLRSLTGEQLVFSNTDLTNSRVHNYKRMQRRRIVFQVGVALHTPADKLAEIPPMIKDVILVLPDLEFDRAHFLSFGDSRLVFEVVYFVLTDDFNKYMDRQQAINLSLVNRFATMGVEFALPTEAIIIRRQPTQ
ncbi:mechanosensitive ion channel family protein [Chitinophaga horti]|uniref:Mechanosensitive ion channel family protein n=1 Tax=Chitinophaga horti TaxID=2920382 RepID=A0ABY6IV18_9BACT|nr:mechanosensitive ion channel family protein [Chitinophaga horti]UYQ91135.1 mechanosensitive ion channel family protein [Chitinophaga horti]